MKNENLSLISESSSDELLRLCRYHFPCLHQTLSSMRRKNENISMIHSKVRINVSAAAHVNVMQKGSDVEQAAYMETLA